LWEQEEAQALAGLEQLELLVQLVEPRPLQVADLRCKHLAVAEVGVQQVLTVLKVAAEVEQQGLGVQAEKGQVPVKVATQPLAAWLALIR